MSVRLSDTEVTCVTQVTLSGVGFIKQVGCYPQAMLKRDYEGQVCSIARTLELVGDRWTLLVIRDVVLGNHRFDQLLTSLGVASNVLTDRLNRLVAEGILERVHYNERPERFEYRLTQKGRELGVPLITLMQWSDRYVSDKPPRIARRRSDRSPITARLVGGDGSIVRSGDVELVPGPEPTAHRIRQDTLSFVRLTIRRSANLWPRTPRALDHRHECSRRLPT